MLLRRRAAIVDIVDETFVRADPAVVREALDAPGLLDRLWPDLEREVGQDRGTKGVRWRTGGAVTGRLEIWLEPSCGGTIVHHYVHGEHLGSAARFASAHRRRWKGGINDIKDGLEGRSR